MPPDEIETHRFEEGSGIPNHPSLPVLVYRRMAPGGDADRADALEARFRENGWGGTWRWGVYDFHHFHSNAHEVLGVASGSADLAIGGPDGETLSVSAGDVLLLPAGTGHKCLRSSPDFQVVGAYPKGQGNCDLIKLGETIDAQVRENIKSTALPERDPLLGSAGGLVEHWKA